jgi:hypothetical protein
MSHVNSDVTTTEKLVNIDSTKIKPKYSEVLEKLYTKEYLENLPVIEIKALKKITVVKNGRSYSSTDYFLPLEDYCEMFLFLGFFGLIIAIIYAAISEVS